MGTAQALIFLCREQDRVSPMTRRRKIATIAGGITVFAALAVSVFFIVRARRMKARPNFIQGAIVKHNVDTKRESPIEDVKVSAAGGLAAHEIRSDFSG